MTCLPYRALFNRMGLKVPAFLKRRAKNGKMSKQCFVAADYRDPEKKMFQKEEPEFLGKKEQKNQLFCIKEWEPELPLLLCEKSWADIVEEKKRRNGFNRHISYLMRSSNTLETDVLQCWYIEEIMRTKLQSQKLLLLNKPWPERYKKKTEVDIESILVLYCFYVFMFYYGDGERCAIMLLLFLTQYLVELLIQS
eukprot:snap_masked-scaffold_7-processed-gene-13.19-mRNA-1 protein AED:1.00 eAED:1.00 QI:0/-1/0/0/-1/1/1/0/194